MDNLLPSVRGILGTTPARWHSLIEAMPQDRLQRVPRAGEWSAIDCLRHIVETERGVFPTRVRKILAGEDFDAFDPDLAGAQAPVTNPGALVMELAALRADSLALVDQLTPTQLSLTARNPELGIVTLAELLHTWAGHDLMHTVQAERSLLQPFITGSGPWRFRFADHEA